MSMFHFEMAFAVSGLDSSERLEEHLDYVLEALAGDARVIDPDYTASLATGAVDFSVTVEAETEGEGLNLALAAMRAAIHGSEGFTPGWAAQFNHLQTISRDGDLVTN